MTSRLPIICLIALVSAATYSGPPAAAVVEGVAMASLDTLSPVTDAMLASPPDADWLGWRRTQDAHAFSPLSQITRNNVSHLRPAWTFALKSGVNHASPLVHDGVLFLQGFGDDVHALDAASGRTLWTFTRTLPDGSPPRWKRNIALYRDLVYVATSDSRLIALDAKTGVVRWDHEVAEPALGYILTSGPTIARGVVMIGTMGDAAGGNFVAGLDAATGDERWRWYAIARPGEPGGDTWNNIPTSRRTGGSFWIPGTYDTARGLVYLGPAPTYDTYPLRTLAPGAVSTDALFTDATVAIDPETGLRVWHYQHMRNDQWDYDWAFERTLVTLAAADGRRPSIVTGGKIGIFDALDADGGRYVFSFDLGLQNVVTAIDPVTGDKTVDRDLLPVPALTKLVCPHALGARPWLPTAYNATRGVLFVSLAEICMNTVPFLPEMTPVFSGRVGLVARPRLDGDGNFGRLQAIDLQTRAPVWTIRQRAFFSTGLLNTAGGLLFAGSLDRMFSAYDDRTGARLWTTSVEEVPDSPPISFSVNGRQYIALTTGIGGPIPMTLQQFVPEFDAPPGVPKLWVFALP